LAAAEKKFADARELYQKDLIARRETEQAEAAVKTARAQKEAAQAQLAQRLSMTAQTRHVLGLARVTAPMGGVVTRRWSEPGAPVAESAPILSVASMEALRIVVHLKSKDTEKIRPGTAAKVNVDASPGREFRGIVTQVQDLANFTGDELSVEIEVANPGGALKFGTPASVAFFAGERRDGLFVPKAALIQDQGSPSVYVSEGGIARQRHVTPGEHRGGEIEVTSDIEPGNTMVVSGAERLTDGSRVRVVK
jgi:RND family efflux transporter MFP subunit